MVLKFIWKISGGCTLQFETEELMNGYSAMVLAAALLVIGAGLLINELLHLRASVQPDWQMFLTIAIGLGCMIGGIAGLMVALLV